MTVVEFFDKNAIENVFGVFGGNVDKVVFVGDSGKKLENAISIYREIAEKRGKNIEFTKKTANRNNLLSIVEALNIIVKENEECAFDLTGGDDLYLVAVGIVYSQNPEKVQLHRYNVNSGKFLDCDADGNIINSYPAKITVEENIKIYGGKILYDEREDATYRWDLNPDFVCDLIKMRKICLEDNRLWNLQMTVLGELMYKNDGLEVVVDKEAAVHILDNKKIKPVFDENLLKSLENARLISNLKIGSKVIEFRFKNEQIKRCLTKAGQILELYVTVCAMECENIDGTPVYNDVICGAVLDWDGKYEEGKVNIDNEIDVMLMKDFVPVFISCKNGDVRVDELYKLEAVAKRFGGKYAKKVLVAPELDKLGASGESICARAAELDIQVIYDCDTVSQEEFIESLCKI